MNVDKRTFNSLPTEIIKEILCYTGSENLYKWKSVCSYWNSIIQELLNIQEIPLSAEVQSVLDSYFDDETELKIYQAPRSIQLLIDKEIISDLTGSHVFVITPEVLEKVSNRHHYAVNNDDYEHPTMDPFYKLVYAMIGLNPGLTNPNMSLNQEEKETMENFDTFLWYNYSARSSRDAGDLIHGIVVEYPDSRTFAILHRAVDMEPAELLEEPFYGYY